jgi:dipeptidyl aminopeptidase/acylaminoacyl peptidase
MRFVRTASVLAFVVACGGAQQASSTPTTAPKPQAASIEVKPQSAPAPEAAPTPPEDPTVLSDDDKKRDQDLAKKIAPYVDAYSNVEAMLTKDKKKVLFRSNRDGLWKAYLADATKPNSEAKKLSDTTERVVSAQLTRDEKYVVYRSDTGADEQFSIFRVGLDGSGATNLTPGEKLRRDQPHLPRLRAGEMIYSARALKETGSRVYTQDVAGGEPKLVYKEDGQVFVADVSPDGSRALLLRQKSASDATLLRLDVDAGKVTRLYPREGKTAAIQDAAYSADGKRVYVATDDGQDGGNVVLIEPGVGVVSGRYKEEIVPTANVAGVIVSPKDDRVVVTVDAGNHTELRILDAKTLKLQKNVKLPLGVAGASDFSDDGTTISIRLGTPDKPNDVYALDAASGNLKPLRADVRPGLKDATPVEAIVDKIQAFDGLSIPVHAYLPKQRAGKQMPVIVAVHGGPSASSFAGWNATASFFVSQGYAWVEPNIRGSTGFGRAYEMADNKEKRGDALKDVESVNAWVKAQTWADKDKVVVYGGSYGGYIVLMALTRQAPLWRAGVDLVGVSSLTTLMKNTSGVIRAFLTDEFGDLDKEQALLEAWSPLKDADKITAPLMVYQGQNDPRVPRSEADQVVHAVRARKVPVEYWVAMNEGHSIDRRETRVELYARMARFLGDQLKK